MGDELSKRSSRSLLSPGRNLPQQLIPLLDWLRHGEYDPILAFLQQQNNTDRGSDQRAGGARAAAEQVCRSCRQLQDASLVYGQAITDLAAQEKALQQQLWKLLQLTVQADADPVDLPVAPDAVFEEEGGKRPFAISNWLQRARAFFRRGKPSPETTATADSAGLQKSQDDVAARDGAAAPALDVYCLGLFRVYNNDALIEKWPGVKCQSIFKYMIVHRARPAPVEVLLDLFWHGDEPEAARHNLYQAIYLLRQVLQENAPSFAYVISADGRYGFNHDLNVWLDAEAFERHYKHGRRLESGNRLTAAMKEYEAAAALYHGSFFAEDPYEDWMQPLRERLLRNNLSLLNQLSQYYLNAEQFALSISYGQKILIEDNCHEEAHRLLMTAYARCGQRHLALRQYHHCVEALRSELDVAPSPATERVYRQIKQNYFAG